MVFADSFPVLRGGRKQLKLSVRNLRDSRYEHIYSILKLLVWLRILFRKRFAKSFVILQALRITRS